MFNGFLVIGNGVLVLRNIDGLGAINSGRTTYYLTYVTSTLVFAYFFSLRDLYRCTSGRNVMAFFGLLIVFVPDLSM